jgi:hypothetical protein
MEADYGLTCNDASGVKIKNLTLITKKTPVADFKNSKNVVIDGLFTQTDVFPIVKVSGSVTGSAVLKNLGITNPEKQLIIGKEVPKDAVQLVK